MAKQEAYNEILSTIKQRIEDYGKGYYLSWCLRMDLQDKYSTAKINYELKKAVKSGELKSKSFRYGIEYSLNK